MPPEPSGEEAHLRALETLYASAPINGLFRSTLVLPEAGKSEISFTVGIDSFHAAGAAHGTLYFKMLDDAAFYAANGLVSDRFLLTTALALLATVLLSKQAFVNYYMFVGGCLLLAAWVAGDRDPLLRPRSLPGEVAQVGDVRRESGIHT